MYREREKEGDGDRDGATEIETEKDAERQRDSAREGQRATEMLSVRLHRDHKICCKRACLGSKRQGGAGSLVSHNSRQLWVKGDVVPGQRVVCSHTVHLSVQTN